MDPRIAKLQRLINAVGDDEGGGIAMTSSSSAELLDSVGVSEDDLRVDGVTIVPDDVAERANFAVCIWLDPDQRRGIPATETVCHDCETRIIYSNTVPKSLIKLCLDCAISRAEGGRA